MKLEQFYELCKGNIQEASTRIPGRALMLKLIRMLASDPSKSTLDEAIKSQDAAEAFRAVHTLKGVCLSLGLESLASTSSALCELLRAGAFEGDWETKYRELCAEFDKIIGAIAELEDE